MLKDSETIYPVTLACNNHLTIHLIPCNKCATIIMDLSHLKATLIQIMDLKLMRK